MRWPQGIVVLSPAGKSPQEKAPPPQFGKTAAARGDYPQGLTQKRMLKVELEGRHRTLGACKDTSEMFGGLQQR
ncbi:MAG: hypothetical protein L0Z50_23175, partial [Verrucomicrobiales bacterium]|nr:hypothetical protein [Verrucomicrobiales bacterium]